MSNPHDPSPRPLTRRLCAAAFALTLLALPTVLAQQAGSASQDEDKPVEMEKVVVTGSLLPTVDTIGPSPVTVLTREKLEETGLTQISEVLRRLPQSTGPSFDEKFQNSFAPGTAGVSLRGLGQGRTLVLMNGRRLAPYGFGQNINEVFVDLNSLPLAALERVDILKDSASALYGSDAIGGVVNLIMRKGYDGTEFTARYGNTTDDDASEQAFSVVTGITTEKSSALFIADYYHREAIFLQDRDYSYTANQTWQGGNDWRSGLGPDPSVIFGINGAPLPNPPGYDFGTNNSIVRVNPDGTLSRGSGNRFDFNPYISAIPETTRYGFVGMFDHKLADWATYFAEASYRNVNTVTYAAPTPIVGNQEPSLFGYGAGTAFIVPASNPYNPFGTDVTFRWRPAATAGPRINEIDTDAIRLVNGLRFDLGSEWQAETAFLYSVNKTINRGKNYLSADRVNDALVSTDPDTALNVFAPFTYWDPVNQIGNNPAVIDSMKVNTFRQGKGELLMGDANAHGPLFEYYAGTMQLFVGAEGRRERIVDTPDALSASERIVSSGGTATEAARDAYAFYAELGIPLLSKDQDVPLVQALDLQAAIRYDHYDDFGGSVNPKIGAKWTMFDGFALRGSYGQGFKAPSLVELYSGNSISYPFLVDTDPRSPYYNQSLQYRQLTGGNPDLEAEESESFGVGAVFEPVKGLMLHVDYWKINLENAIGSFDAGYIQDNFPQWIARDPVTYEILMITNTYANLSTREEDGIDFGAAWAIPTEIGDFTLSADVAYMMHVWDQASTDSPSVDYAGTYYYPKWRAQYGVFWRKEIANEWTLGLGANVNYIGSYDQYYAEFFEDSKIDAFLTLDLQATVDMPYDFKLTVGVLNVTDEPPPFSDSDTEGYDIATHDPRGRFWYLQASKKF